jgi:hypothetical protein
LNSTHVQIKIIYHTLLARFGLELKIEGLLLHPNRMKMSIAPLKLRRRLIHTNKKKRVEIFQLRKKKKIMYGDMLRILNLQAN